MAAQSESYCCAKEKVDSVVGGNQPPNHQGNGITIGNNNNNNNNAIVMQAGRLGNAQQQQHASHRGRPRTNNNNKHVCTYSKEAANGICTVCRAEHSTCVLIHECCKICYKQPEQCPKTDSKAYYIVNKLETLKNSPKVIIFSQFRIVLNMIGDRLLRRFGGGCVAEYWGRFRNQELHRFQQLDNDCFCFLLGKDGSEGLDLSFVTHIIFVEKVYDKSLEEQAVARAWRMGASGAVQVETLIAQESVEETMRDLDESMNVAALSSVVAATTTKGGTETTQAAKVHYLLKTARLIANNFTMSFGGSHQQNKRKALDMQQEDKDKTKNATKPKKKIRFNV
mmetsp:Transcript_12843/g.37305  ORF Transcript_12843/g.37305 Transcript_12843/m.37305 type:complete len:338 (+) Transcript_12843:223-1236(+)